MNRPTRRQSIRQTEASWATIGDGEEDEAEAETEGGDSGNVTEPPN